MQVKLVCNVLNVLKGHEVHIEEDVQDKHL